MEVHAHTHTVPIATGRKKWTHYLWEFLMLFLAVFCGFLAENFREHVVEHQREKQFMASLVEDLEIDTSELKKAIRKADSTVRYSDSTLIFLTSHKIFGEVSAHLANLITIAGDRLVLINTDRTSSQLKNSGAMRMIRNKKVVNAILQYWKQIDETNITLERYLTYRNAGRELLLKLWVIPEVYRQGLLMPGDSIHKLKVLDNDPKKWGELANITAVGGLTVRSGYSINLEKQYQLAIDPIALIKKEYQL